MNHQKNDHDRIHILKMSDVLHEEFKLSRCEDNSVTQDVVQTILHMTI